jgi:hypothetical protein
MTTKRWRQIWTKIGNAYATPFDKRTSRQCNIAWYGLCYAIDMVLKENEFREFDYHWNCHYFSQTCGFWFHLGEENDNKRATIAYFMANLSLREAKAIRDAGKVVWNANY